MRGVTHIRRWCVAALLLLPASAPAQTNTVVPTNRLPEVVVTDTRLPSVLTDADRFFEQFNQAAALVRDNHAAQASLVMDESVKNLGSSPWLDIAMLKASGLQETRSPETALASYALLTRRLNVAPYFQGDAERAKVFRVAIQGAIDRGITRIRTQRIRSALAEYHARYRQYPESLQKLSILGYVEMEDVHDAAGHLIRYLPTGLQYTPAIAYQLYELAAIPAEPFMANAPYLTGTSQVNDQPLQYAALFRIPGRADPERVTENQTFSGFFVAAVANRGAILVTPERVLVLPVRP